MPDKDRQPVLIVLAGIPMGKQRIRIAKDGHAYTPERTVKYEGRLAYAAQQAMGDRPLLAGPLHVRMDVYMDIPKSKPRRWREAALRGDIRPTKKPDSDNFAKMLDACNMIVWIDDSQIVDLTVSKRYSDSPRMVVEVREIEDASVFA